MIPDDYVPDLHSAPRSLQPSGRVTELGKDIDAFGAELIDRFGPLPLEVSTCLKIVYIKSLCRTANVEKLDAGPKGVVVQFRNREFPNPGNLVGYIAKQGTMAKIRGDHSIFFQRDFPTPEKRLAGGCGAHDPAGGIGEERRMKKAASGRARLFPYGKMAPSAYADAASVFIWRCRAGHWQGRRRLGAHHGILSVEDEARDAGNAHATRAMSRFRF